MKVIKFFITMVILSFLLVTCEKDGGTSVIELDNGAVPNFQKLTDLEGFLNLNELNVGNDITFGYSLDIAIGDVASADVIAFFRTATGNLYGPKTLVSGVNSFPYEQSLSQADIIATFDEITDASEIFQDDALVLTATLYLTDGRVFKMLNNDGSRNYGSDIHTSAFYNAQIAFAASCPLDETYLLGEYYFEGLVDGDFGPTFGDPHNVEIVAGEGATERMISLNYLANLAIGQPNMDFTIDLSCGFVVVQPEQGTGLGCGDGEILLGPGLVVSQYDVADDSVLEIEFVEGWGGNDGGCGFSNADGVPVSIRLTKL